MTVAEAPTTADAVAAVLELLARPGVTDVLVNGPQEVWWDRGGGLERAPLRLADRESVRHIAVRLAAQGGRRLDDAQPVVDARLRDGSRLHAVLEGVASGCTLISLRRLRVGAMTFADLEVAETFTRAQAGVLRELVDGRRSLLISGPTGSGKTTLLGALLSLVGADERVVVIEEAGELQPVHPHVVRLVERRPNVDGAGAVEMSALVRESLRMRPDRVVLGECRGAEVREVMMALNTGHSGGMATVHANAAAEVPARLVALGSLAGMAPETVAAQAAAAFDAVVHMERTSAGRRVADIVSLGCERGEMRTSPW